MLAPRTLVGRWFRLDRYLGSGAAGDVYAATVVAPWKELPAGTRIALKFYKSWLFEGGAEKQRERIEREAELSVIEHENLVRIYGADSADVGGQTLEFLAMEFVDGQTLTDYIAGNPPLSGALIKDLMLQLCGAVAALHDNGKFHRDIKPDNIMVGGSPLRLKLMDFGVIKDLQRPAVTESYEFLGTVRYAAPEWILGKVGDSREAQALVDLYSVGAVMADLINGFPLFPEVRSRYQIVELKIRSDPPIVRADVPVGLISIAHTLIRRDPRQRAPRSARELLQLVRRVEPEVGQESLQERLQRRLLRFGTFRTLHEETIAEAERKLADREAKMRRVVSACRELHDSIATRFATEEWAAPESFPPDQLQFRASFGLARDEQNGILYPMTFSTTWSFPAADQISVQAAGFYWHTYYERRGIHDALTHEVSSNWAWRLRDMDPKDTAYKGPYVPEALQHGLENTFVRVFDTFLLLNEVAIRARRAGEELDQFELEKIRQDGRILGRETAHSELREPASCLIWKCPWRRLKDGFLCPRHLWLYPDQMAKA